MGFYTKNGGLIGTNIKYSETGVYDIINSQLSGGTISDLRVFMGTIATAIQNGRTGYILTTNNYNYNFGTDASFISDGGNDMYDNANFTSPVDSSTRSTSSPSTGNNNASHPNAIYYDNTTPLTHPSLSNYTYVAGGWVSSGTVSTYGPLIVAATTGNSGYQWCGWMKGGNSGADGGGSKSQVDLYNGDIVNGFTVYSSYMSTYGAGDPSCNDLYILLGHPSWGTNFGTINTYNNTSTQYANSAMWSDGIGQNNVLAIALLIARSSGVLPVQSEMQGIVDDIISDIKTEFGY